MDKLKILSSIKLKSQTQIHPNKQPFMGILTTIDSPSLNPPVGSNGKNVILDRNAVEKAINTLIGMPINASNNFNGHQQDSIIGIINKAYIDENNLMIEGDLFPQNNPKMCANIKAEKNDLGFSYELLASKYSSNDTTMVVTEFTFIGACLLYKESAAYGDDTQLIAAQKSSKKETDINMNEEQMKALLDGLMTNIKASVDEVKEKVANFETKLVEVKASMEEKVGNVVSEVKAEVEKANNEIVTLAASFAEAKEEIKASKEKPVVEPAVVQASATPEIAPPVPTVLAAGQTVVPNSDFTDDKKDKKQRLAEVWAGDGSIQEKMKKVVQINAE